MNKKTVAIRENILTVLSQLGRVWEVPFGDGRITKAIILTLEGVRSLGIDFNRVFIGCGGKEVFDKKTDVKKGILVNLDLYQQVALLKEIVRLRPELRYVLGLYNLEGSGKAFNVFIREMVPDILDIEWMWVGERSNPENIYPKAGIITLDKIGQIGEWDRFISRNLNDFGHGHASDTSPICHTCYVAVIFGAQI